MRSTSPRRLRPRAYIFFTSGGASFTSASRRTAPPFGNDCSITFATRMVRVASPQPSSLTSRRATRCPCTGPMSTLPVRGLDRKSEAHELGDVANAQLLHDAGLVDLHRARTDTERGGDLFRMQSLRGVLEYLALARGQGGELFGIAAPRERALDAPFLKGESRIDRGAQLPIVERFLQKVDCFRLKRRARRRHVAVGTDENERQCAAARARFGRAAVRLGNGPAHCETEPHAARLAGNEGLEDRLRARGVDSRPVVG